MDEGTEQAITKQQTMMGSAATGPQASHAYLGILELLYREVICNDNGNNLLSHPGYT